MSKYSSATDEPDKITVASQIIALTAIKKSDRTSFDKISDRSTYHQKIK
ncbi:MAG: hypothetical protein V7K32_01900 [Nostoc sp.]